MKNIIKIFLLLISINSFAQEDLEALLESQIEEPTEYAAYTFKATRIINTHSIERMPKRELDVRVNHRFGAINSGAYEFFGLDHALINLSLEYGITDWMMIGIRRGTFQKTVDGSVKFSILRQSSGKKVMPISFSYYGDMAINGLRVLEGEEDIFNNRLAYTHQLLVARKFNNKLSLQVMPTIVHRNRVNHDEENDTYAMGIGGRYKITNRMTVNIEYYLANNSKDTDIKYYNPIALGFDIETGGHVFQLFVTNAKHMVEKGIIAETTGDPFGGDLFLGFNISRVFTLRKGKN